ncbi:MAG: HlyD family efflux transporter periplasmic adaptor subunit [Pirellula sp.]|jgi:multidrug resistance efflux pump|nr:HlyD family efflux transporter periplasmic adaptor subunit [Pirellula sp.]
MLIKFGIPIFAAVALGFGIATLTHLTPKEQLAAAPNPPPLTKFEGSTISGLGEIQMAGEPVSIATAIAGIVANVHVVPGQSVLVGDPLFTLDDRALRAELNNRKANLATVTAKLKKLKAGTRPEDIPPAQAKVAAAAASLERHKDAWERAKLSVGQRTLSEEEFITRRCAFEQSLAELGQSQAELEKLKAGAWSHDIMIAELEAEAAQWGVEQIQIDIDRLVVRAPVDGLILHVDIRPGEIAESRKTEKPLVQLGVHGPLRVRVQIDEEDASRVRSQARAEGYLRGRDRSAIELRFLRIDPRIVPKSSLVGGTTERVDTRVLYVVYEIVAGPSNLYAGQKLDVFMEG